jgi:hypothetical protein
VFSADPQRPPAGDQNPQLTSAAEELHQRRPRRVNLLKLSNTNSRCRFRRYAEVVSSGSAPARSPTPKAAATTIGTSAASLTSARSTQHIPSGSDNSVRRATANANRVFPIPPGPVTVSSRVFESTSSDTASSSSASRPTIGVTGAGKLSNERCLRRRVIGRGGARNAGS